MIDLFFAVIFTVLSFTGAVLLHLVIWFVAWCLLFITAFIFYWVFVSPLNFIIFSRVSAKYEKIYPIARRIYSLIENRGKLSYYCVVGLAIFTLPFCVLDPSYIHEKVQEQISGPRVSEVVDYSEVRQYKLLDITNPKHVYVTLEDVNSEYTYRQYVSKHCGVKNSVGDRFNIEVTVYHMSNDEDKKFIKFHNLERVFCQ